VEDGTGVVPAKGGSCGPGRPRAGGGSGSCGPGRPPPPSSGRVGLLLQVAVGGSTSSSERRWVGWPPPPSGWRRRAAATARGEVSGCVEMARATRGASGRAGAKKFV
jgi:hypothetical protein